MEFVFTSNMQSSSSVVEVAAGREKRSKGCKNLTSHRRENVDAGWSMMNVKLVVERAFEVKKLGEMDTLQMYNCARWLPSNQLPIFPGGRSEMPDDKDFAEFELVITYCPIDSNSVSELLDWSS
jgi:hypothetical protein